MQDMVDLPSPGAAQPPRDALFGPGLRGLARGGLSAVRVGAVLARSLANGDLFATAAPCAVFLPSRGREMSALLRIYMVANALRRQGWRTAVVPWTLDLAGRRQILAALRPDVVVMQGSRHALNRPDLYAGAPVVYDIDDADFHLPHLASPVAQAMPQVAAVIAGSRYVADWCRDHGARRAEVVWTGTPLSRTPAPAQGQRGPMVAWAQSAPVDYTEEREVVLSVVTALNARCPGVRLRLYGRRPQDDEAILRPFRSAGIAVEWVARMDYGRFLASLDDVAVGLSPLCPDSPFSRGKSFGKVLAYMDRGVPAIVSDAADHAIGLPPGSAVVSNDTAAWVDAAARLLGDPQARQDMADRARATLEARFSPGAVARLVDPVLRSALSSTPRSDGGVGGRDDGGWPDRRAA